MRWIWILLSLLWIAGLWAGRHGGGGDFEVLWRSVSAAWSENPTGVYLKESSGPFFYPPIALILFGGFAFFREWSSAVIANLIFHSVSYWGFWWLSFRLYGRPRILLWLLPFGMAIAPMHLDFMGQNIELPLTAALAFGEWLTHRRGRVSFWGGFVVGVTALIKLFPLLLAVTYLWRKPRTVSLGLITGGVTGLILPFLVFGWETGWFYYRAFFETLTVYHDKNLLILNPGVLNLPALLATWLNPWVSTALRDGLVLAIPGCLALFFLAWSFRHRRVLETLGVFSLAMTLMTLLNSSSRPDYFVFFVPGVAWLTSRWAYLNRQERIGLLLGFLFIAGTQQAIVSKPINIQLEFWRIPVLGMLALAAAQFLHLKRQTSLAIEGTSLARDD